MQTERSKLKPKKTEWAEETQLRIARYGLIEVQRTAFVQEATVNNWLSGKHVAPAPTMQLLRQHLPV